MFLNICKAHDTNFVIKNDFYRLFENIQALYLPIIETVRYNGNKIIFIRFDDLKSNTLIALLRMLSVK